MTVTTILRKSLPSQYIKLSVCFLHVHLYITAGRLWSVISYYLIFLRTIVFSPFFFNFCTFWSENSVPQRSTITMSFWRVSPQECWNCCLWHHCCQQSLHMHRVLTHANSGNGCHNPNHRESLSEKIAIRLVCDAIPLWRCLNSILYRRM